jgi:membrane glycosyltransferase
MIFKKPQKFDTKTWRIILKIWSVLAGIMVAACVVACYFALAVIFKLHDKIPANAQYSTVVILLFMVLFVAGMLSFWAWLFVTVRNTLKNLNYGDAIPNKLA